MTKTNELLAANILTASPKGEAHVRLNVPLDIPKVVIDEKEGLEIFARNFGWQEQIHAVERDANGEVVLGEDNLPIYKFNEEGNPLLENNPVPAYQAGIQAIQGYAWSILESALIKQAQAQALLEARKQVEALKGL